MTADPQAGPNDEIGHYRQLHALLDNVCPPDIEYSVKSSLIPPMLQYANAKYEEQHGIYHSRETSRHTKDSAADVILNICNTSKINFTTLMARLGEWAAHNISRPESRYEQRLGRKMPTASMAEPAENYEDDIKPIKAWLEEWWKTHGSSSPLHEPVRNGLPLMLYKYELAATRYSLASTYNEKEDARRTLHSREGEISRHCNSARMDYIQLMSDFSTWRKEQYSSAITPFAPSRGKT